MGATPAPHRIHDISPAGTGAPSPQPRCSFSNRLKSRAMHLSRDRSSAQRLSLEGLLGMVSVALVSSMSHWIASSRTAMDSSRVSGRKGFGVLASTGRRAPAIGAHRRALWRSQKDSSFISMIGIHFLVWVFLIRLRAKHACYVRALDFRPLASLRPVKNEVQFFERAETRSTVEEAASAKRSPGRRASCRGNLVGIPPDGLSRPQSATSRKYAAPSSGGIGLMKKPVPHSNPAVRVNRGRISMCHRKSWSIVSQ